jgi:hypothetical protein
MGSGPSGLQSLDKSQIQNDASNGLRTLLTISLQPDNSASVRCMTESLSQLKFHLTTFLMVGITTHK